MLSASSVLDYSDNLIANLENAAQNLAEMLPAGFIENSGILDDSLSVFCTHLGLILELGVNDITVSFAFFSSFESNWAPNVFAACGIVGLSGFYSSFSVVRHPTTNSAKPSHDAHRER